MVTRSLMCTESYGYASLNFSQEIRDDLRRLVRGYLDDGWCATEPITEPTTSPVDRPISLSYRTIS